MTQEHLKQIRANILSHAEAIEELVDALETAWQERDEALQDGLVQAVKIDELTIELDALKAERGKHWGGKVPHPFPY
jgi:ATP:corrinoid adenosyltransferase